MTRPLGAEIVYMPGQARLANVAIRPAARAWEVVIGALPGVAPGHVVPVAELVVGVHDGRFLVRWPAGDVEIAGVQAHMLNPAQAPVAARFLLAVASDGQPQLAPFSWGGAASFPFLPRVQRGRIVLAPAQWRLGPVDELAAWLERWWVPRHVYLAAGDPRLLLDLDDADQLDLLRDEVRGLADDKSLVLQEALPGTDSAWLPGVAGGHMAELIVPLVARESPTTSRPPARAALASSRERLRLPGSDWLYLQLYCPQSLEDQLIAGPLLSFGEFATGAGLIDGWYFVRYVDPRPHLRVRFHGKPSVLWGPLLRQVFGWADDLVTDELCDRYALETYEREVERYGGAEGMSVAESMFFADSPAVAALLRLSQQKQLSCDLTGVAVLTIDDLLDGVGLDVGERRHWCHNSVSLSRQDGDEYRRRKHELRLLLTQGGGGAVTKLLASRRAALEPAAQQIRESHLHRTLPDLCRSYVHLHVNRLLGAEPTNERLALQLLRRTRESLHHAP